MTNKVLELSLICLFFFVSDDEGYLNIVQNLWCYDPRPSKISDNYSTNFNHICVNKNMLIKTQFNYLSAIFNKMCVQENMQPK